MRARETLIKKGYRDKKIFLDFVSICVEMRLHGVERFFVLLFQAINPRMAY